MHELLGARRTFPLVAPLLYAASTLEDTPDRVKEDLKRRIVEMESMVATLEHLTHNCHGDDRPDCPILEDLARLD